MRPLSPGERQKALAALSYRGQRIFFFAPHTQDVSCSPLAVIYQHVLLLRQFGHDAALIPLDPAFHPADWLGPEYGRLPHLPPENGAGPEVRAADFLVIPEGLPELMESTASLPCQRVVLCQSARAALSSLPPGKTWADYGIDTAITVSQELSRFLRDHFGLHGLHIHLAEFSVPGYFHPQAGPRQQRIAVSAGKPWQAEWVVRSFSLRYPRFRSLGFTLLQGLDRRSFARELRNAIAALWIDPFQDSSAFPIECAASGIPFVAQTPFLRPGYSDEGIGLWHENLLALPDLLATLLEVLESGPLPSAIAQGLARLAARHEPDREREQVRRAWEAIFAERFRQLSAEAPQLTMVP